MGAAGSDAALETADVALMADELLKIPTRCRLSRATVRNIKANLAISMVMKAAFVVAAVAGRRDAVDGGGRRHRRVDHRDRERAAVASRRLVACLPELLPGRSVVAARKSRSNARCNQCFS